MGLAISREIVDCKKTLAQKIISGNPYATKFACKKVGRVKDRNLTE